MIDACRTSIKRLVENKLRIDDVCCDAILPEINQMTPEA